MNLRLDTLTARRAELSRLAGLEERGQFDRPAYPILPHFQECDPTPFLNALPQFANVFEGFAHETARGFTLDNDYFSSPDAEIAYTLVRLKKPKQIVEVGSGNSTLLFRSAIKDGGLATHLTSIDPLPRRAIEEAADRVVRAKAEDAPVSTFEALEKNDVLFIDSSHEVKAGNDLTSLALAVLPRLRSGVLIHFHDIRLPFEYPYGWVADFRWNEQYLVQALLQDSSRYSVIWPGYYLQRTLEGFEDHFPNLGNRAAGSLWIEVR
jgi:predicted O-methyltransferase YrrM